MITKESKMIVLDNSGIFKSKCIETFKPYSSLGDLIKVSRTKYKLNRIKLKTLKKIFFAFVVSSKKEYPRSDGFFLKYDYNCICLLNEQSFFLGSNTKTFFPKEFFLKINLNSKKFLKIKDLLKKKKSKLIL